MDIRVEDHGTVALLFPLSEAGDAWVEENIQTEGWQHFGGAIACEPRTLPPLVAGAEAEGLTVELV